MYWALIKPLTEGPEPILQAKDQRAKIGIRTASTSPSLATIELVKLQTSGLAEFTSLLTTFGAGIIRT